MRISSYKSSSFKQMRRNSHTMNLTLLSYMIKWVFFLSMFTSCTTITLIQEYFDYPRKKCYTHRPSQPTPSSEALTAINLLSSISKTSMTLPLLGVSQKWNHIICGLSSLAFFTLAQWFQGSSMQQHISVLYSSLWLSSLTHWKRL